MSFTDAQSKRIIDAITAKSPMGIGCSVCGTRTWTIQNDGLVYLAIQPSGDTILVGGPSLPSVAIICRNCGNTLLLNVLVLGIGDAFGLGGPPLPPPPSVEPQK